MQQTHVIALYEKPESPARHSYVPGSTGEPMRFSEREAIEFARALNSHTGPLFLHAKPERA